MSYNKIIEIYCDHCSQAYHVLTSSLKEANKDYKAKGGIVKNNGTHYCDCKCYENGYFENSIVDDVESTIMPPKNKYSVNVVVKSIEKGKPVL